MNKSDRIVVTGAAGLMGSALVEHLRVEGYENVIGLRRADCDLMDMPATFAEFERRRPDHVFHAAARVYGLGGSMKRPYQESYGLRWAYIVSANLFGPRDRFDVEFGNVVPSLVKKFYDARKSGGTVAVWGDASAQRDFVYIKDAARIALGVMTGIEGAVNMGSGDVHRIRDVVDALADLSGMSGRIEWDLSKPNGQAYRAYDLAKIRSIGLKPAYSLRAGLDETWSWYCAQNG